MGQEMNARPLCGILVAVTILFLPAVGSATGLCAGTALYTIDLSDALDKVPDAVSTALNALEVPQADADQVLAEIQTGLSSFPRILPVPLLVGTLEVSLPLGVVDTLRFSGGFINDGIVRGAASLFGTTIPHPLIRQEVNEAGLNGAIAGDLSFSTFSVSAEAIRRLDLIFLGLNLGLGLELTQGRVTPQVSLEVPSEYDARAAAALAALHTDGLSWTALAVRGAIGIEIGPPFLRLAGEARIVLPVFRASGWWGIKVSDWGFTLGFVIRL
jgi:hypothetical protein